MASSFCDARRHAAQSIAWVGGAAPNAVVGYY
jgi:hypothetical protein